MQPLRRTLFLRESLALVVFFLGAIAHAGPSIAVTSPAGGQPASPLPTLTIAYAPSPGVPLNIDSLSVLVNGSQWASKFLKTETSASLVVSQEDALVAGIRGLVIDASIGDQAGETASVHFEVDVLPVLQGTQPTVAAQQDQLTLTVLGLDSSPPNNVAVFQTLSGALEVPFTAVDRVNNQGLVNVPEFAVSGPLPVRVNGKESRQHPWFPIIHPYTACGAMFRTKAMAGAWILVHTYSWQPNALTGSQCPNLPDYQEGEIAAIHGPTGSVEPIFGRKSFEPGIATVAVTKAGGSWAVLAYQWDPEAQAYLIEVHTVSSVTQLRGMTAAYYADFDAERNLYVVGAVANEWVLAKVSAQDITAGGPANYSVVTSFGPYSASVAPRSLAVSCEGRAYVAVATSLGSYVFASEVREIDLATGNVTRLMSLNGGVSGNWVTDVALTATPGEVLGLSMTDVATDWFAPRGDMWHAAPDGGPEQVMPLVFPGDLDSSLTVVSSGRVYVKAGWEIVKSSYQVAENPETHQYQPFCSCPSGLMRGREDTCEPAPLAVTASTTRWKPSRSNSPVTVDFTGPDDVDLSTPGVLEIQPPAPAPPMTLTGTIEVVGAGCTAGSGKRCYRLTWAAPWVYTDNGVEKRLPPGNYSVVVKAMAGNTSPPRPVESAPYDKVSLVEVKKVELAECGSAGLPSCQDGGAAVTENAGPGGGKAAYPDGPRPTQAQPNPDYRRTVLVKAELEPNLGPDAGQVTVHFRSIDVDDPSAGRDANGTPINDPVDNDTVDTPDNRNENAPPTLTAIGDPSLGGAAVSYFQVSTQQGNNYRLAASTHEPWLADLCGVVSSTTGELVHGPCTTSSSGTPLSTDPWNNEAAQRSEMLTVWRTLHLEVDALVSQDTVADQAAMDFRDPAFTFVAPSVLLDISGSLYNSEHPALFGWFGANLALGFHASDWYDVAWNNDHVALARVRPGQVPLTNGLTPQAIFALQDKSYILRDDEITSLDSTRSCGPTTCAPNYSLATQLLAAAYIKLEPIVQAPADTAIPFAVGAHRNMTTGSNYALLGQVLQSRSYWATQLVSAFDGDPDGDLDPTPFGQNIPINLGLTTIGSPNNDGGWKMKSSVFMEAIRDLYEKPPPATVGGVPLVLSPRVNTRVTAHEILHQFSLIHDGAIMCAEVNIQSNTLGDTTTPSQRKRLRDADRPTPPEHNNPCPQP